MAVAVHVAMGGARRVEDLIAWKAALEFKREVYRLLGTSSSATRDFDFRDQLRAAAASAVMNIGEGFRRFRPREFIRYLEIALASLGEAVDWLKDGIDRGHFTAPICQPAFALARGCHTLIVRLIRSLRTKLG